MRHSSSALTILGLAWAVEFMVEPFERGFGQFFVPMNRDKLTDTQVTDSQRQVILGPGPHAQPKAVLSRGSHWRLELGRSYRSAVIQHRFIAKRGISQIILISLNGICGQPLNFNLRRV